MHYAKLLCMDTRPPDAALNALKPFISMVWQVFLTLIVFDIWLMIEQRWLRHKDKQQAKTDRCCRGRTQRGDAASITADAAA